MCRWYSPGIRAWAEGALASNCRSLGVQLACEAGASVPCTHPPSAQVAKPSRTNPNPWRINPDLTKADESVTLGPIPQSRTASIFGRIIADCVGIWACEAASGRIFATVAIRPLPRGELLRE